MLYRHTATAVVCTSMLSLSIRTASTAQLAQHSTAQHSTAQRNHSCTKQQTKYVPIRVRIKTSTRYVGIIHACGVRVVCLEHGPLGICMSPVCT